MTDTSFGQKPPRFKKIPGVPTLKTYPVEGMESGIKIGGSVGAVLGVFICAYWGDVYIGSADLVVVGCMGAAGAFVGFLLGALTDKLRGKWNS
jgi:hypothetical protein